MESTRRLLLVGKTISWNQQDDCCLWDGVVCDQQTGCVISLDLSSSCLYGPINSSSSLFCLGHLQRLNLADNDFDSSQIPSGFRSFPRLAYLNLSFSEFYGKIPLEISGLSRLRSLDLNGNSELTSPDLMRLVQNLTHIEKLYLDFVDLSAAIPGKVVNLSSLSSLSLYSCGSILSSLSNLSKITLLELKDNNFFGEIPSALANLTQLTSFSMSGNDNVSCGSLSWLGKQTEFLQLDLENCNISGEIPPSLKNFTQLNLLLLNSNHLSGQISHWLTNRTRLAILDLGHNEFRDPFPHQISELVNLEAIYLRENHLSGFVNLNPFFNLQHMERFYISVNATLRKWHMLGLRLCNLREFPDFLRYQDKLEYLNLSGNKIRDEIPSWLWNISRETLEFIGLAFNCLTGFEQPALVSRLRNLKFLVLDCNKIQGPVPRPPPSIFGYTITNNSFSGEISSTICNLPHLYVLDLSFNNLSGMLPNVCLTRRAI
ncbi:receptor-like protein 7 [Tripterygium wilfordii]|uniref:receptor-like protein 7 n=1 Tax=Tripterygium wilfordii TaxID=458696 RepID=UPI0018F8602A|nr:receptor-like protein 7 [Tripterygium wilfordii]